MALIEELLPASFKGASFLIASASTVGGRKDSKHEFPNSNRQTIEDLGLSPRVYSIVGWITGPNYIAKRDILLRALETSDVGVLSHPFYGELQRMKSRSFTISETLGDLGRAELSMVFEVSDDLGVPIETENTLSLINTSNDSVLSAANSEIADTWKVDTKFSGNFGSAQSKLGSLTSAFTSNTSVVVQLTDKINAFNADVSDFGNDINSLISQPQALADSITNLVQGVNGLFSTSSQQLAAWKGFFGFGDDDAVTVNQTAGLFQRNKNNNAINQTIQTQALSGSYLAASEETFNNVDELDALSQRLELQFQKVMDAGLIGQDLLDSITDIRENTNTFFNQRRVNLNRIITVNTAQLPARAIAYQYYGESDLGEDIASLNNDANVSFLEGQIQVLTE